MAVLMLARNGVIVIRGAVSQHTVSKLASLAESTWAHVVELPLGQGLPNAILNRDQNRALRGYKALVESDKPVINVRYGEDQGMMDIFHPERLDPEHCQLVLNSLHEGLVGDLSRQAFGVPLNVTCRNLYINKGVSNTRFFHCDGERVKVKSFLYLNDVSSLDVGPYCYIRKSHRDQHLRRRNQKFNAKHQLNKHEYRLLAGRATLPLFCHAGDMVVSAQHGAHRGYPQQPSAQRAVLLNVYEPARKHN
ncbi:MAG: hypothetical protein AAFX65_02000 [Cyanobacteria bacterium J06638_7]